MIFDTELKIMLENKLLIVFLILTGMLFGAYIQADSDVVFFQQIMNDSARTNGYISDGIYVYTIEILNGTEDYEINFYTT